jgi:hypothetical protein
MVHECMVHECMVHESMVHIPQCLQSNNIVREDHVRCMRCMRLTTVLPGLPCIMLREVLHVQ